MKKRDYITEGKPFPMMDVQPATRPLADDPPEAELITDRPNPMPPRRRQGDMQQTYWSDKTALDFSNEKELVRKEFAKEQDINHILRNFGVNVTTKQPYYGEQDFDLDRQQAMHAINDTKEMFRKLPPDLRAKYGDWSGVLNAVEDGSLQLDIRSVEEIERANRRKKRENQELEERKTAEAEAHLDRTARPAARAKPPAP